MTIKYFQVLMLQGMRHRKIPRIWQLLDYRLLTLTSFRIEDGTSQIAQKLFVGLVITTHVHH